MQKVIEIKDLTKRFKSNEVLKGLSLSVQKGENLVLIGKSGEGKSVTLKCITGLMTTDGGSIKVFDREVASLNEDELKDMRCRIGFLFQGSALYDSMTVKENLAFPLRRVLRMKDEKEIDERSRQVLEAVGLIDTINKMPGELSGGMRKRLALARTLIVHPEIILYDEPTTGLDTITSREISELILEMKEKYNTTSLIVTHDIPCAKIVADRIVVMRDGKSVADGKTKDLENSTDDFIRSFFN